MFCNQCGRPLPEGSAFCNFCGAPQPAMPPAGTPGPSYPTPTGPAYNPNVPVQPVPPPLMPQDLRCNSCGAPLKPSTGLALVVCEYCGAATTVGAGGAAQVVLRHFMLTNQIGQEQALAAGGQWLNQGIFRRKVAERSDLGNVILRYVPYWVIPTQVVADFQGTRGTGVAEMRHEGAAGKAAGIALLALTAAAAAQPKNRNRPAPPPVVRVRDRIQLSYTIPIVAVRGYTKFQPDDGFQFQVANKIPFDKRQSGGVEVMSGDVTEGEAKQHAAALAHRFAEKEAKKRVDTLEGIQVYPTMADGELLHAPVWFVEYSHKGKNYYILIDGNSGRVMDGERPAFSLW